MGVLYSNVANNAGDMVNDIHALAGTVTLPGTTVTVPANQFNGQSVIDTAVTLGDRLADVQAIAMHSAIYSRALKANEIQFFKPSDNSLQIPTYKGMAVIVDDNSTTATAGVYVTILFGPGAVGYAVAPPRTGYGTEIWRVPSAGNGGGQTTFTAVSTWRFIPLGLPSLVHPWQASAPLRPNSPLQRTGHAHTPAQERSSGVPDFAVIRFGQPTERGMCDSGVHPSLFEVGVFIMAAHRKLPPEGAAPDIHRLASEGSGTLASLPISKYPESVSSDGSMNRKN